MKRLHRSDLFCWSAFSEKLNVDFNGFVWIRPDGNIVVDPMALSPHDEAHLESLGGVRWIVLTNSAHVRATEKLIERFGAQVAGPAAERDDFPIPCARWLVDGDSLVPGLIAFELQGSKTPGELALVLEEKTLICGDLVRAHRANQLMRLLPEQGLEDAAKARASIERLATMGPFEAVLVGDGWCAFGNAHLLLRQLADELGRELAR